MKLVYMRHYGRPYQLKEGYNIPEDDYQAEYKFEEENPVRGYEIIPLIEKGFRRYDSQASAL